MLENNYRCPFVVRASLFLFSFWIFFQYIFSVKQKFLFLLFIVIFELFVFMNKVLTINVLIFMFAIFGVYLIFSAYKFNGYAYPAYFALMILVLVILSNARSWQSFAINFLFLFSFIHVFSTFLTFLFPSFMDKVCLICLSDQNYYSNLLFKLNGVNPGITVQTGLNSFYISTFIGIVYCNYLSKNKKLVFLFLLSVSIFSLFLTSKRGPILFTVLTMVLVSIILSGVDYKRAMIYIFLSFLIILVALIILKNVQSADIFVEKFDRLKKTNNTLNNRDVTWSSSVEAFLEAPMLGKGSRYMAKESVGSSHNIYLQLLVEYGLLGFSIFVCALFYSLKKTVALLNKLRDSAPNSFKNLSVCLYMQIFILLYAITENSLFDTFCLMQYIIIISVVNSYDLEITDLANDKVYKKSKYIKEI